MSSGEKQIVILKISVTNFCRFQYIEDFDTVSNFDFKTKIILSK